MSPRQRLDVALKRLTTALDYLDAAAARRVEQGAAAADVEAERAVMQGDRARLAQELDVVTARARRLEGANHEVAERLARVGASLAGLLEDPARPAERP